MLCNLWWRESRACCAILSTDAWKELQAKHDLYPGVLRLQFSYLVLCIRFRDHSTKNTTTPVSDTRITCHVPDVCDHRQEQGPAPSVGTQDTNTPLLGQRLPVFPLGNKFI